jgi:hypothetical protein
MKSSNDRQEASRFSAVNQSGLNNTLAAKRRDKTNKRCIYPPNGDGYKR